MKIRVLSVALVVLMLLAIIPVSAFADGAVLTGKGTEAEPYLINSIEDLVAFRDDVNNGNTYAGKYVKLMDNIDMSSIGNWVAIGNGTRNGKTYTGASFKGTFDGNMKLIRDMKISIGETIGFFGIVDGGKVTSLGFTGVNINATSGDSVGTAVAVLLGNGNVWATYVGSGTVSGKAGVGGIVGRILVSGTVLDCPNYATVIQTGGSDSAGGIVGKAYYTEVGKVMTIRNSSNFGSVASEYCAGGIVGFSAADVYANVNEGTILSKQTAGGIVGEQTNYGSVYNNLNKANVSAGNIGGGIVGWVRYQTSEINYPLTENIEIYGNNNYGKIAHVGNNNDLGFGGIVGNVYNQAYIHHNNNYAPEIKGTTFAAGILGSAQPSDGNVKIPDANIIVELNYSETPIEKITANCKNLYAYLNLPSFNANRNNTLASPINLILKVNPSDDVDVTVISNGVEIEAIDGKYSIKAGVDFTVIAEKEGYEKFERNYNLTYGLNRNLQVNLIEKLPEPEPEEEPAQPFVNPFFMMMGQIEGIVTDDDGNAVYGAKFDLYQNGAFVRSVKSNINGKFVVSGIMSGKYELVQTEAPEGTELITEPIEVIVNGARTANVEITIAIDEDYEAAPVKRSFLGK